MRSIDENLELAEDALNRWERETDHAKRMALLRIARERLDLAVARMEQLGIFDMKPRADRLAARLNS